MLVTRTQCVCSITAAIVALAADTALIIELQYVLVTRNPRPQAVFALLWPPIVMGRPLYFTPLVSIFLLSSSCFFSFFPRLISAVRDWMSTMLPHMMWH